MADRFSSILVANRGEIALRIIRTAKALGYRTVAVASEVDRGAPHALAADELMVIGAGPVNESYLDIGKILDATEQTGAEAIHPGYGFLSENATFARAVQKRGLTFIGPSPEAVDLMGDKARAKRAMIEAGVPCIPGYQGEDQSLETLKARARETGFPLMIKAAAGGGGRGMRLVTSADDLDEGIDVARREAESAFGSGDLILERAVLGARHVEVQVFGDLHGTIVHLGERDCSLQRRHQKVIEEAPSPAVNAELRARMGEAAVKAARAVDYVGAGTVEFLLGDDGVFYFLEMNTRLQVEHPVTEEVTGLDLVELQLRVAQGEPLGFSQDDVRLVGHAIEARLYAEDPAVGFQPSTGPVKLWTASPRARTDVGIATGDTVTPFYDPMLAKVVASGKTREDARRGLIAALSETVALGITTNRRFLIDLLEGEAFASGQATTRTIDESPSYKAPEADETAIALAACLLYTSDFAKARAKTHIPDELAGWQCGHPVATPFVFPLGEIDVRADVLKSSSGFVVKLDDRSLHVDRLDWRTGAGRAIVDGRRIEFHAVVEAGTIFLALARLDIQLTNKLALLGSGEAEAESGAVLAPMHGLLTQLLCKEGDVVEKGQRLALVEAMKMQHDVRAPFAGTVSAIRGAPGTQVVGGDTLLVVEPEKGDNG